MSDLWGRIFYQMMGISLLAKFYERVIFPVGKVLQFSKRGGGGGGRCFAHGISIFISFTFLFT